ncbi:hypothetical protein [Paucisalibacillus globulus]|nr:hypothetical protein [Paucisalibacillus globulus]
MDLDHLESNYQLETISKTYQNAIGSSVLGKVNMLLIITTTVEIDV